MDFQNTGLHEVDPRAIPSCGEGRLDPNDMIGKMIALIPDETGPFRNIFPQATQAWFEQYAAAMLERVI